MTVVACEQREKAKNLAPTFEVGHKTGRRILVQECWNLVQTLRVFTMQVAGLDSSEELQVMMRQARKTFAKKIARVLLGGRSLPMPGCWVPAKRGPRPALHTSSHAPDPRAQAESTREIVLSGSTTAVATCGQARTVKLSVDSSQSTGVRMTTSETSTGTCTTRRVQKESCRPVQLSAHSLALPKTKSMISLSMV